jgi:hypothetical protein
MILIRIKMVTIGDILKHGILAAPITLGATKAIPYLADRFGEFAAGLVAKEGTTALTGMANIAMSRNSDFLSGAVDFGAQALAYASLGATAYGLERAAHNTLFN